MQVVGDGEHETIQDRSGGKAASVIVVNGENSAGTERTGRQRKRRAATRSSSLQLASRKEECRKKFTVDSTRRCQHLDVTGRDPDNGSAGSCLPVVRIKGLSVTASRFRTHANLKLCFLILEHGNAESSSCGSVQKRVR